MSALPKLVPRVLTPADMVEARLRERGLWPELERAAREGYVTVREILGTSKTKSVLRARHALWAALMGEPYGKSSVEVGAIVGVEHSVVSQAVRRRTRGRGTEVAGG